MFKKTKEIVTSCSITVPINMQHDEAKPQKDVRCKMEYRLGVTGST